MQFMIPVQVRHEIDIDNDTISLYYNGELITSWPFSTGSTGFSSVLDALNLYGFVPALHVTDLLIMII